MKPDPSFYEVDRDDFLSTKPIEQRLSCHYLDYDYEPIEEFYKVGNSYILKSFHGIFSYVSGELTPSVVVDPETSQSFCSLHENRIQLGTNILADDRFSQQQRVDAMYAVMLHEMWHKRYTNADLKKRFEVDFYYDNDLVRNELKKLIPSKLHVDVLNILEDYRIEKLGLREFPGYVFYFDSLREFVVTFQQSKEISLADPGGIMVEYLMFSILIPEMLPWFMDLVDSLYTGRKGAAGVDQVTMMNQFSKFNQYIADNQSLVYSDNLDNLLVAVNELVKLFPKDIRTALDKHPSHYSSVHSDFMFAVPGSGQESDEYLNIVGDINKVLSEETEAIEAEKASIRQTPGDEMSVRIEKINIMDVKELRYDEVHIYSPIARAQDPRLITESKSISGHISRDLGFMASRLNQIIQNFELPEGDLDEDELYAIGFSKNIFQEEEPKPGFELDFGILLDESGSMSYSGKIWNAMVACLGIATACIGTPYINLFVYGHSQGRHDLNSGVELYEYINTKRGIRDVRNIQAAKGKGANADGYAIAKVGEIMIRDSQAAQKVLVVISDGLPMAAHYAGEGAERHVRSVTDMLEQKGIEVIQLCIDNIDRSQYMFKNYIPYDAHGNFGKDLREIMQRKLHKFMESL